MEGRPLEGREQGCCYTASNTQGSTPTTKKYHPQMSEAAEVSQRLRLPLESSPKLRQGSFLQRRAVLQKGQPIAATTHSPEAYLQKDVVDCWQKLGQLFSFLYPCPLQWDLLAPHLLYLNWLHDLFKINSYLFLFLFKDNCFTKFCFLTNLNMNQP